jgi:hypothetical protein
MNGKKTLSTSAMTYHQRNSSTGEELVYVDLMLLPDGSVYCG